MYNLLSILLITFCTKLANNNIVKATEVTDKDEKEKKNYFKAYKSSEFLSGLWRNSPILISFNPVYECVIDCIMHELQIR